MDSIDRLRRARVKREHNCGWENWAITGVFVGGESEV